MQQLNSPYQGDRSDSLSNIMGMQYQPQNQLNQFTSQLGITGINNASATNRAAMQNWSSEKIAANNLRETTRFNTLNYMLGAGRLGMDMDKSEFDMQKDIATFRENRANKVIDQQNESDKIRNEKLRVTAGERLKTLADADADKAASAAWGVWERQADDVLEQLKESVRTAKTPEEKARYEYQLNSFARKYSWAAGEWNKRGRHFMTAFSTSPLGNPMTLRETAIAGFRPQQSGPAAAAGGGDVWSDEYKQIPGAPDPAAPSANWAPAVVPAPATAATPAPTPADPAAPAPTWTPTEY
jgi:hypothetical protein